jgi:ABC-2 type transport system permease protein
MALTTGAAAPTVGAGSGRERVPRAWDFARLKLRITANTLGGQPVRAVMFAFGVVVGLAMALGAFAGLAGSTTGSADVQLLVATFLGTALVSGWSLAPLLFFGVDETLDPARFALLPLPRRRLALGMLTAACVGIPAVATLLASLGLVWVGAAGGGLPGALVGLAGAAVTVALCVIASRALTSAFAGLLRSRRTRDLAAVLIALLASAVGPAWTTLAAVFQNSDIERAVGVARVLAWTPLGAPFAAAVDAGAGRWGYAVARLAIGVAAAGLLAWWWSFTLESAMIGTASGGVARGRQVTGGIVASLFPRLLRGAPRTVFGAILARESRYWWRDPRRRAGLISLAMAGVAVPLALVVTGLKQGMSAPLALTFAGVVAGTVLANQFGIDGTAYAVHLLTGVPGRVELRARAAGLAVLMVPVTVVLAVGVTVVFATLPDLPAALGTVLAGYGVSAATASVVSVFAAYPVPDSSNPFSMSGGSAGVKGLLAMVGMFASLVLLSPVLVLASVPGRPWNALALPVGLLWGAVVLLAGTHLAGRQLDRHGPELLTAVTPRR